MSTRELMRWFERAPELVWNRWEVESGAFEMIRTGIRSMYGKMLEADERSFAAIDLRRNLFSWLTGPIEFDDIARSATDILGTADSVQSRWGEDVRSSWDLAQRGVAEAVEQKSPLVQRLVEVLESALADRRSLAIYCHRSDVEHFQLLQVVKELDSERLIRFLHSPAAYRDIGLFDELVRVGPFKAFGYGKIPPSLITAPKYGRLSQVVWSGLWDDPASLSDPLSAKFFSDASVLSPKVTKVGVRGSQVYKNEKFDEIDFWQRSRSGRPDSLDATVLFLSEGRAIAYPVNSERMILDLTEGRPGVIENRPVFSVKEGKSYLIFPELTGSEDGSITQRQGRLSPIWKEVLRDSYEADPEGIVRTLYDAGLSLTTLAGCIQNWSLESTNVIHAPQKHAHFQILLKVLLP